MILILMMMVTSAYVLYQWKTWHQEYQTVVVASGTIEERNQINKENVELIQVIKDEHFIDTFESIESLENYYVNLDYTISEGTIITSNMVTTKKPIIIAPDHVSYSHVLNPFKAGGLTIEKGHLVDIYGVIYPPYEESIVDILIQDVEVIGLLNRNGQELEEKEVPYLIQLSIPKGWIVLLSTLEKEGTIEIYTQGKFANKKSEPSLKEDSRILKLFNNLTYQ